MDSTCNVEGTRATDYTERVVPGWDVEVGYRLPDYTELGVFLRGFNWDYQGDVEDKGIVLKDILEDNCITDRDKAHCIDASYYKGGNLRSYFQKNRRQIVFSPDGCAHVGEADLKGHDIIRRVYSDAGKSPTLTTMTGGNRQPKIYIGDMKYRKLSVRECEALQGLPMDYTSGVSNTRRYAMIGNGFTVPVISHILQPAIEGSV